MKYYLKIKKSGFNYHNIDREYKKRNKGFIEPGPLMLWKYTTTEGYRQSKYNTGNDRSERKKGNPMKGKPITLKSKDIERILDKDIIIKYNIEEFIAAADATDSREFIKKLNKLFNPKAVLVNKEKSDTSSNYQEKFSEDIFKNKRKLDFFIEMVVRHHQSNKPTEKLWYNNYEFGFYNTNL